MAHVELKRPIVKSARVFFYVVSDIENRAGDVGAASNQQQEPSDSNK